MGRLRCIPTRTRPARRDASTTFRFVRGTLDGTPRPRSDSYEAPSTGRLDRVPTRTRLVRLSANLRLARPRVGPLDPPYSPTLRQKSEHLMRLPTTSYRHGYSCDRRGSSTGVRSHFLLPIPGWEVKPITIYTMPHTVLPSITLEGGYDKDRTPRSREFGLIHPSLTHPRPGLDPASTYHQSVGRKGRRGTGLGVFSPSRPLRHHCVQGWPAIPGARRYSHLHRDRQNFTSRHPQHPSLLLPYKRAGQGSTRNKQEASQKPSTNKQRQKDNKP
jgi:hypothetical protein